MDNHDYYDDDDDQTQNDFDQIIKVPEFKNLHPYNYDDDDDQTQNDFDQIPKVPDFQNLHPYNYDDDQNMNEFDNCNRYSMNHNDFDEFHNNNDYDELHDKYDFDEFHNKYDCDELHVKLDCDKLPDKLEYDGYDQYKIEPDNIFHRSTYYNRDELNDDDENQNLQTHHCNYNYSNGQNKKDSPIGGLILLIIIIVTIYNFCH